MGYVNANRCDPSRPDEDRPHPMRMGDENPPLHEQVKQGILMSMDELESSLFDFGPTEYIWVLTEVIKECATRIANRTGAA